MSVNCITWNANSLKNKVQELKHFLISNNVDIACISETNLDNSIHIKVRNYLAYRKVGAVLTEV